MARDASLFSVYLDTLAAFDAAQLDSGVLRARVDALATLIRPAVEREDAVRPGALDNFNLGIEELRDHVQGQDGNVTAFLAGQAKRRVPSVRDALLRGGDQAAKQRWMRLASWKRAPAAR